MLWAMLHDHPVNTCYYLLDYLASLSSKPKGKGEIVVGGIITYIARKFGVGEDQGLNRIEGNNRLNIDTLIAMNFIKPHPPDNMSYELQLNVPLCLIILPNPSHTNTEVEDNLLYVGDDTQVHEEDALDEEEVQTCTNMRSTMTMKPKGITMTIDGHGCKPRFRG